MQNALSSSLLRTFTSHFHFGVVRTEDPRLRFDARGDRAHALRQLGIGVDGLLACCLLCQLGLALR